MDYLSSFYPSLSARRQLPVLYLPVAFLLSLVPFLTTHRRLAVWATFPLLIYLCVNGPKYTSGDVFFDYSLGGTWLALVLWYLDFVILTPVDGPNAVAFRGDPQQPTTVRWVDNKTTWERLIWASRLMLAPHRGIGWNWQVKHVPPNHRAKLPKWTYVQVQLFWAVLSHLQGSLTLVVIGFCTAMENRCHPDSHLLRFALNAAIGWSGALWIWNKLNGSYCLMAAASVAVGGYAAWEWPQITGPLRDAWSVRQMWSVVYHQMLRRILSNPGQRLARFLRLKRGGIASRYLQLYLTFGISCIWHEMQIFNVTRRDGGEFAFFMLQPVAITLEDFVIWTWGKLSQERRQKLRPAAKITGYIWVVLWFSLTLQLYLKSMRDANIMTDVVFQTRPYDIGTALAGANLPQQLPSNESKTFQWPSSVLGLTRSISNTGVQQNRSVWLSSNIFNIAPLVTRGIW